MIITSFSASIGHLFFYLVLAPATATAELISFVCWLQLLVSSLIRPKSQEDKTDYYEGSHWKRSTKDLLQQPTEL